MTELVCTQHVAHAAHLCNEDSILLALCAVETCYNVGRDTPSSVEDVHGEPLEANGIALTLYCHVHCQAII